MSLLKLRGWGLAFWRWLTEGRAVFLCLFVIVAAVSLSFSTWCSESSIKWAGYVLQLLGMAFAIRGLLKVRSHFGQPLLRSLFIDWLKRFPRWNPDIGIGVGAVDFPLFATRARGEVWSPDDPNVPIEQRVEAIVRNLERIRQEQHEHADGIEGLRDGLERHKKTVEEQAEKLKKDIHLDLESLHTSDLITALVGLVWLVVGITMSTLAPEIHQWLI